VTSGRSRRRREQRRRTQRRRVARCGGAASSPHPDQVATDTAYGGRHEDVDAGHLGDVGQPECAAGRRPCHDEGLAEMGPGRRDQLPVGDLPGPRGVDRRDESLPVAPAYEVVPVAPVEPGREQVPSAPDVCVQHLDHDLLPCHDRSTPGRSACRPVSTRACGRPRTVWTKRARATSTVLWRSRRADCAVGPCAPNERHRVDRQHDR